MVEQAWERNGKMIKHLETGERELFKTCNLAKKASHKLQMENSKMLGVGDMRLKQR